MSVQEKGELPNQRTPEFHGIHGSGQIQNNEGGYVNKIDDIEQLRRFVIIGSDRNQYYANYGDLLEKNVDCIQRLINQGRGVEAVNVISRISVSRQNLFQEHLLYALAVLARSSQDATKKAAYSSLPDVCRIPTHLFIFIKYCEQISSQTSGGTGWGRAHKTAITKWYESFAQKPEKLARLISKYKCREGFSHKDVLRLTHPKSQKLPDTVAFINCYIIKNLTEARNQFADQLQNNVLLQRTAQFLEVCDSAKAPQGPGHLCHLIQEHRLSWEHCSSAMLTNSEVWAALLPHMNVEAMIRNLGKMTNLGLFAANSEGEDKAVEKIDSINTVAESDDVAMESEMDQNLSGGWRNLLHPYQILNGWLYYRRGSGEKSSLTWDPNERIVKALEEAFYKAFETVGRTGKKFFLAIHMSGEMTQPARQQDLRSLPFDFTHAAACMMMATARTEDEVIIKGFSDQMIDLNIEPHHDLDTVIRNAFPVPYGGADCSLPMKHAVENKIRDIDVFVIYTNSQTVDGNVHASEALRQYRHFSSNPEVKLVVCGMCASQFTIADPEDCNMLDVVGFDAAAPRVISEFVQGL